MSLIGGNFLEDSCLKLRLEILLEKKIEFAELLRFQFSLHKGVLEPQTYLLDVRQGCSKNSRIQPEDQF